MDDSDFCYGEVFVPCNTDKNPIKNVENSITIAEQALRQEKLVLVDISKYIRYVEEDWDDDSDASNKTKKLAARARHMDQPVFGLFHSQ